jgi:hypothetical protein
MQVSHWGTAGNFCDQRILWREHIRSTVLDCFTEYHAMKAYRAMSG